MWQPRELGLALTKGSQHKRAAIEALQFLTSEASQIRLYEEFATQHAKPCFEIQNWWPLPRAAGVGSSPATAAPALTPVYAQISDLLYRQLSLFTGRVSPEQGMAQLQQQTLQLRTTVGGEL